jgi:hypothetical protein
MEVVTQQLKNAKAKFMYKDQREKIERRSSKKILNISVLFHCFWLESNFDF